MNDARETRLNICRKWMFTERATAMGAPFDFVSTHMYPTDPELGHGAKWNPDGLANHVKAARASIPHNTPFYLTEYNVGCCIGYNGHDTSASAAFAFRTIPALDGVTDVLSWWTFTDVRKQPPHAHLLLSPPPALVSRVESRIQSHQAFRTITRPVHRTVARAHTHG